MQSLLLLSKPRLAAVCATLALGAGGGLMAGCGGDSQNAGDALSTTIGTVTTAPQATPPVSTETVPAQTSTDGGAASTTPAPGNGGATATATTPNGGAAATTPQDTGGHAAPDDDTPTTPTTSATTPSAKQDPDCRPGTGPGQADPQCEPVSGPDAQDEDPR